MKVYKVKVNGKVYEVEVESVKEVAGQITQPATPVETKAPTIQGAAQDLNAPMAGTILNVLVNVGDTVKEGQVICILEAMKLENEVVSPCAGVVKSVAVSKGTTVQNGQLIAKIG